MKVLLLFLGLLAVAAQAAWLPAGTGTSSAIIDKDANRLIDETIVGGHVQIYAIMTDGDTSRPVVNITATPHPPSGCKNYSGNLVVGDGPILVIQEYGGATASFDAPIQFNMKYVNGSSNTYNRYQTGRALYYCDGTNWVLSTSVAAGCTVAGPSVIINTTDTYMVTEICKPGTFAVLQEAACPDEPARYCQSCLPGYYGCGCSYTSDLLDGNAYKYVITAFAFLLAGIVARHAFFVFDKDADRSNVNSGEGRGSNWELYSELVAAAMYIGFVIFHGLFFWDELKDPREGFGSGDDTPESGEGVMLSASFVLPASMLIAALCHLNPFKTNGMLMRVLEVLMLNLEVAALFLIGMYSLQPSWVSFGGYDHLDTKWTAFFYLGIFALALYGTATWASVFGFKLDIKKCMEDKYQAFANFCFLMTAAACVGAVVLLIILRRYVPCE